MKRLLCLLILSWGTWPGVAAIQLVASDSAPEDPDAARPHFIVVVGAEGLSEYGDLFRDAADRWKQMATEQEQSVDFIGIEPPGESADHDHLMRAIETRKVPSRYPLWIVLIGHGTFDRKEAKFNLRGPDVGSEELKSAFADFPRPLVFIHGGSCSGTFVTELSGSNRIIITATRSGAEENYARFGEFFSRAILDPTSDLDHDREVSLLEAFLFASKQVEAFYTGENRLATEHALLDDNGDRLGTLANFYRGIRPVKKAKNGAAPDGRAARQWIVLRSKDATPLSEAQFIERQQIETEVESLREQKGILNETDYYERLEALMIRLAELQVPTE